MVLCSARRADDAVALEVVMRLLRGKRRLAVDNEFAHRAEESNPTPVDDGGECWGELVLHEVARMPPDAAAYQMANGELIHEEKVAFNLVVKAATKDLR